MAEPRPAGPDNALALSGLPAGQASSIRRLAAAVLAAATVTLLAGCATSPTAETASSPAGGSACTESATRHVVASFIDAFNKGDGARLDQLFYDVATYATDAPGEFSSAEPQSRSDFLAYFTRRHQVHERLQLESFGFNGDPAALGRGGFEFELTRSADDGLAPTPYGGKGAVFCRVIPSTLLVWVMGREPYLRARLPLYASLGAFLLAVLASGAVILWRRRNRPMNSSASVG